MQFRIGKKQITIQKPRRPLVALLGLLIGLGGVGTCTALQFKAGTIVVEDVATATDQVDEGVIGGKGTWLTPDAAPRKLLDKGTGAGLEHGSFAVTHVRPCRPGLWDVSAMPTSLRDLVVRAHDGQVCGVIWSHTAQNFLADEAESNIPDCVYRATSCPTAFTMSLLSTAASPAETSTWAALSANELAAGTSPGYAAAALTRDSTGWPTLDTVASGTGGCTETLCGRVSTAQVTITATGNWTVAARYITIRATVGGAQRHFATAQLSADRQLQSGDQLNLTYRQALQ